tara:strand:- start:374 stop:583 length:210 start_codon:yes stop_codon:yes gene_type:complete
MAKKAKVASVEDIMEVIDFSLDTKSEPVEHEIVEVDSVIDYQPVRIKGYLTDAPINEVSKAIRYPSPTE